MHSCNTHAINISRTLSPRHHQCLHSSYLPKISTCNHQLYCISSTHSILSRYSRNEFDEAGNVNSSGDLFDLMGNFDANTNNNTFKYFDFMNFNASLLIIGSVMENHPLNN